MAEKSEFIKDQNGIWIWNPNPMEGESVLWHGPVKNGFAEGKGHLTWYYFKRVISTYKGEMRLGKPHGHGVYRFADGDIYEGSWENGVRQGFGRHWYSDGTSYVGEWIADLPVQKLQDS
ncbi:MAG: hypothetical protein KG003_14450 [Bacteroidetes bacterium]|nr:hypothetical protein [Bacteroidota bacterium]MBS3915691.1 hypothetical protein [Bacteroidota bacterium]